MKKTLVEMVAKRIQKSSGDIAFGYSNYAIPEFVKSILFPLAKDVIKIIQAASREKGL